MWMDIQQWSVCWLNPYTELDGELSIYKNHPNDMLGYETVMDYIKANGAQDAEEQKQALLDFCSA